MLHQKKTTALITSLFLVSCCIVVLCYSAVYFDCRARIRYAFPQISDIRKGAGACFRVSLPLFPLENTGTDYICGEELLADCNKTGFHPPILSRCDATLHYPRLSCEDVITKITTVTFP